MTFLSTKKETGAPVNSNTGSQPSAPQETKTVSDDTDDDLPF